MLKGTRPWHRGRFHCEGRGQSDHERVDSLPLSPTIYLPVESGGTACVTPIYPHPGTEELTPHCSWSEVEIQCAVVWEEFKFAQPPTERVGLKRGQGTCGELCSAPYGVALRPLRKMIFIPDGAQLPQRRKHAHGTRASFVGTRTVLLWGCAHLQRSHPTTRSTLEKQQARTRRFHS